MIFIVVSAAVVIVAITVGVAITLTIPAMIVIETAAIAVPVTFVKSDSIMAGCNPARSLIGRPGPITHVPCVTISNRVPVAGNPHVLRRGPGRKNAFHARRRRSSDPETNGNLRGARRGDTGEQNSQK